MSSQSLKMVSLEGKVGGGSREVGCFHLFILHTDFTAKILETVLTKES